MEELPQFILLAYMNRSGSTYLAQHLSRSGNILVCLEADILVSEFLEDPGGRFCFADRIEHLKQLWETDYKLKGWGKGTHNPDWERLKEASTNLEAFCLLLTAYRDEVKPGATHVLFKAERLLFLFGKISNVACTGMVFHPWVLIRDVRAIYESQKRTPMFPGNEPMSREPVKTALDWNRYVRKSSKLAARGLVEIIFYESLIRDLPGVLNRLKKTVDIDFLWEENLRGDVYNRLPDEMKTIHRSILEKPESEKIDEWESMLKPEEIIAMECLSGRWLKQSGYHLTGSVGKNIRHKRPLFLFLGWVVYYVRRWRDKLAFHLNNF